MTQALTQGGRVTVLPRAHGAATGPLLTQQGSRVTGLCELAEAVCPRAGGMGSVGFVGHVKVTVASLWG